MATCKDCIGYEYCNPQPKNPRKVEKWCDRFKNKADFVEVKHGYWKRNERNIPKMKEFHDKGIALSMSEKSIFYTCSCCNFWGSLSQIYCSECGAKMDGVKDA